MWSLKEGEKELSPLVFSNGKTQEDVVKEVCDAIEDGHKIIFIKGVCGTGKSAVALNLARKIGRASIIVPIKSLQKQYTRDYVEKMQILNKKTNEKLKICSIVGRNNFKCKYLEEFGAIREKKEKNLKLFDIFEGVEKIKEKDNSCDNPQLPCKIEIKEKNIAKIKKYIRENPEINLRDFDSIKDVKRMSIACVCPYWSPIVSQDFEIKKFQNARKIKYKGLEGNDFTIYQRKPGCGFYDQYEAYANADVIIFNSLKYKLESLMNRKPATEIEIIDECDEFLDSFSNIEQISIGRLSFVLNNIFVDSETQKILDELIDITNTIKRKYHDSKEEIFELKDTPIYELLKGILDSAILEKGVEGDSNYISQVYEIAKVFEDFFEESYFSVEEKDKDMIIKLVTINLAKRFEELINKNKIIVMMSGTLHSEEVLKNIFGLDKFKIIEAETQNQGELIKCRHGYEINCKYSNLQSQIVSRENYLRAFSKSVSCAKKPVLVHVTGFGDLPSEFEKKEFEIDNLPAKNELIQEQNQDPLGKRVQKFKENKIEVLFTTRCNRGVDFPGEICNSIVISRFPYPNISGIFWKILKKIKPNYFRSFYIDKACRDILQKIYRGLRSKEDKVYLLSPDIRVLNFKFD